MERERAAEGYREKKRQGKKSSVSLQADCCGPDDTASTLRREGRKEGRREGGGGEC